MYAYIAYKTWRLGKSVNRILAPPINPDNQFSTIYSLHTKLHSVSIKVGKGKRLQVFEKRERLRNDIRWNMRNNPPIHTDKHNNLCKKMCALFFPKYFFLGRRRVSKRHSLLSPFILRLKPLGMRQVDSQRQSVIVLRSYFMKTVPSEPSVCLFQRKLLRTKQAINPLLLVNNGFSCCFYKHILYLTRILLHFNSLYLFCSVLFSCRIMNTVDKNFFLQDKCVQNYQ